MPRPWEPGGTEADWSSVLPEHLEFHIHRDPDFGRCLIFHPAGKPEIKVGDIPKDWVQRNLPSWLQIQDMVLGEGFFTSMLSPIEFSDDELGRIMQNRHFWQLYPQSAPLAALRLRVLDRDLMLGISDEHNAVVLHKGDEFEVQKGLVRFGNQTVKLDWPWLSRAVAQGWVVSCAVPKVPSRTVWDRLSSDEDF